MLDPRPGHIRYVKKAVQTTEIDEDAEIGNIFHDTASNLILFDQSEQFLSLGIALFFEDNAPANDDVSADLV